MLNESGFLHKRQEPAVIRFRNFNINKDAGEYYREQIMLYHTWRNEEEDILQLNLQTAYEDNIDTIKDNRRKYNAFEEDEEFDSLVRVYDKPVDVNNDDSDVDDEFQVYNREKKTTL